MSPRSAVTALLVLATTPACSSARWPEPQTASSATHASPNETSTSDARVSLEARIEAMPICIAKSSWSAGSLANTVLYRSRRVGRRVDVGYFVHWSEERPWGANVASYTVVPALATDAFYSHFLWLFPGAKDVIYGPDDIEGVSIQFELSDSGKLEVVSGIADDGNHSPVELSREDLLDSHGRVILLTDTWSHQLGGHGAAKLADAGDTELRCYQGTSLLPMTTAVADQFRLGSEREPLRAGPAWGTTRRAPARKDVAGTVPRTVRQ